MKKTPLADYVAVHGQTSTARAIGVTQGAVRKMLHTDRRIYVIEHDDGTVTAIEEREPIVVVGKGKSAA